MDSREVQKKLSYPFERDDIEYRVSRVSQKTKKVCVLAYITARAIMDRLDEVFGVDGWKDTYDVLPNGVKCCLSVKIGDSWVSKEDVAPFTTIEALKGAFSDSLKRAGVKFGIGRYLYDLSEQWVEVVTERPQKTTLPYHHMSSEGLTGYWVEPQLPEWALPSQQSRIPADLLKKLDALKATNLLTQSKYDYYINSLSRSKLNETQIALIGEQLSLISVWGETIAHNAAIPTDIQKESYLSIINSSENNIDNVKAEVLKISQRKAGEAA